MKTLPVDTDPLLAAYAYAMDATGVFTQLQQIGVAEQFSFSKQNLLLVAVKDAPIDSD